MYSNAPKMEKSQADVTKNNITILKLTKLSKKPGTGGKMAVMKWLFDRGE